MPLTPSRFTLWGRMTLPLLVAAAFFGPSLAAFATSRPVVAVGVAPPPPIPVIQVHPFLNLALPSCIPGPTVHIGPTHRTAILFYEESLRVRMNQAATECVGPSSRYLVLSVAGDGAARITNVRADAGADAALASCATTFMQRSRGLETRGPGALKIGYYIGGRGQ
jgi:hypothetical protein